MNPKTLEESNAKDIREKEERLRREAAYRRLLKDSDFIEYFIKPQRDLASISFKAAEKEAFKPADTRSDARVAELLREFSIRESIASEASDFLADLDQKRKKDEETLAAKSPNP